MRRRLLLSCILTLLVIAEGTTNINDASHTRANGRWLALTTAQTYAARDRIHFAIFDVENWMIPSASAEGALTGSAALTRQMAQHSSYPVNGAYSPSIPAI
jgi:hypothetical protein